MQDDYIDARLAGKKKAEAMEVAGYHPESKVLESRPGTTINVKLQAALDARGMDEQWLIDEYREAMRLSKAGKDRDTMALFRGLLQIGWLMGHGKKDPQVAVQINNSGGSPGQVVTDEPGRVRATLDEVSAVLGALKEEARRRGLNGFHAGDPGAIDTTARPGVGGSGGDGKNPSD